MGGQGAESRIASRDYWFKIVGMLQQNWALIDEAEGRAVVRFIDDASGVFDELGFASATEAADALRWNGFERFDRRREEGSFIAPPQPPFQRGEHPSGPIYSSGKYWRSPRAAR